MHVAIDEVCASGVADRHHGKGGDEEEGNDAQRTVVEELHPQVADLHVGALLSTHHHFLLTLREAEQEKQESHQRIDGHGDKPCLRVFWQTFSLVVGEVSYEQWKA